MSIACFKFLCMFVICLPNPSFSPHLAVYVAAQSHEVGVKIIVFVDEQGGKALTDLTANHPSHELLPTVREITMLKISF